MEKKFLLSGIVVASILIVTILAFTNESIESIEIDEEKNSEHLALVIMPTKSSRPGCDETNSCYLPSHIEINAGESVTWLNEDAAFHSITSGTYEKPNGMFDSGHLDPNESFTIEFNESGTFDYFCTLHPWMNGQVLVK